MRPDVDTHARSLFKACSYRILSTTLMTVAAWFITHQLYVAVAIGVGDAALKIGLFYVHERLWARVQFGRSPPPDYEI